MPKTTSKIPVPKKAEVAVESETAPEIVFETPFVVSDNSPIGFGKLRGKKHSILKEKEWRSYCGWIMNQSKNADWRYTGTSVYIEQNVEYD